MKSFIALLALIASTQAYTAKSGLIETLDIDVIQHSKDFLLPTIFNILKVVPLPEFTADGITITNTIVDLDTDIDPSYVQVGLQDAENAILVTASQVSG